MPDITMCINSECPLHESCYRFTATPNKYVQSYTKFEPEYDNITEVVSCDYFIEIKE